MLQDLRTTTAALSEHLEISRRQIQRYQAADAAPRSVLLAMFWETRWGRSTADCEAANWAALHYMRAEAAEHQVKQLRRQIAIMERELVAAGGPAANLPIWQTA